MASPRDFAPADLVGRTVADGRYEVVRELGQGGMGTVYLARQVTMDRMVALKLISAGAVRSPEAAVRFEREMKLTAKIEHPNTIRVYDFGEIEGHLYLTMELLRGRSLGDVLAESHRLPLDRIVRIATQVARALQAAHAEGVVHRDLKPDNVMLIEQYSEHDVVKVLDFGVAKSMDEGQAHMTATGAVIGTPMYLSPEQAMGAAIDARSDLYSLGVVLYQMAAGRLPFMASSITGLLVAHVTEPPPPLLQVAPDVHPALAALIDELLRKEASARPQSARDVELRLDAIASYAGLSQMWAGPPPPLASLPPSAAGRTPQPAAITVRTPLPAARRGARWAIVGVIVVVGAGVGLFAAARDDHGGGPGGPGRGPSGSGKTVAPPAPTVDAPAADAPAPAADAALADKPPPTPVGPDAATKARLADLSAKLAGFGDPPPPAACAPEAAVAAAALVLEARDAITSEPARAIADAAQAIERCPSFAAAYNIHGNALQKTAHLEDAADAYARALTFAPDYEAPRFNLGIVQLRRKDSAAIATFGELIRRKPELADAYKSRAQAYLNAQRYDEALADFEGALKRAPDDGQVWLIVGQLRDKLHRAGARDAYCKAQRLGVDEAAKRCRK
jgi:eukaryotic-like serine/threonine-protein kinase